MLDLIFELCFKVQLGYHIQKTLYITYYCSLGFESISVVRLPPFLFNIRRQINTAEMVLFGIKSVQIDFVRIFKRVNIELTHPSSKVVVKLLNVMSSLISELHVSNRIVVDLKW